MTPQEFKLFEDMSRDIRDLTAQIVFLGEQLKRANELKECELRFKYMK